MVQEHHRRWERKLADDFHGVLREAVEGDFKQVQQRHACNASREAIGDLVARTERLSRKHMAAALEDPAEYRRER